jgi:hypothetical protein
MYRIIVLFLMERSKSSLDFVGQIEGVIWIFSRD